MLVRLLASAAVGLGTHFAAHQSLVLSAVFGATAYGVLFLMAKVHDPGFQSRIEAGLGQRNRLPRDSDD